jgi:hypothetical protein
MERVKIKYAANFVLLAEEETVLQGMIDRLTGIAKSYGMKMKVRITNVMIISRKSPQYRL